MLLFIIPLKSKQVSVDWPIVCQLFSNTLESIYNQTDPDFKIIAVGHEIPEPKHQRDDRLSFVSVDYPPPPPNNYGLGMDDKWMKLRHAMVKARALQPDFIMFVDADDLVSRHLVAHTQSHPGSNGWIIRNGYRYAQGSNWIEHTQKFDCGTNAIISAKSIVYPSNVSDEERERCILLTHGHTVICKHMAQRGTPLEHLPFPGAAYIFSHGDNATDIGYGLKFRWKYYLKRIHRMRYLSKKIKADLSITEQ